MRTEEEQAEIIREWWEKNGFATILAIVAAIALILGWRQWQAQQEATAAEASALYQNMMTAAQMMQMQGMGEPDAIREPALELLENHSRSAYADYAGLMLARVAVGEHDYEQAASYLEEVLDRSSGKPAGHAARMRLARLYIEMERTDDALALLERDPPAAWRAQAMEIRGDALRQAGEHERARSAYESALEASEDQQARERVRMKLDDLKSVS